MVVDLEYIAKIEEVGTFDDGTTAVRLALGRLAFSLPVSRALATQLACALYRKVKVTVWEYADGLPRENPRKKR